jgi:hypothetical protein
VLIYYLCSHADFYDALLLCCASLQRRLMRRLEGISANTAKQQQRDSSAAVDVCAALAADPVTHSDVIAALQATSASAHKYALKYDAWTQSFGST